MRLLIYAGRHLKDVEYLCLALDRCHSLQPIALLDHLLHADNDLSGGVEHWCRERGVDSRAYDYPECSGSDNTLCEYGEAVLGDAAPDLVLVLPNEHLVSELIQAAHAVYVPPMFTYRPLLVP